MNETSLSSRAEKNAALAQDLSVFSKVNLLGVKSGVAKLLALVGREGIFDEYTVHDISHIDEMLTSLDWIIPSDTQSIMTPADWLLIVLAVYFHDLGMLVTKHEFQSRSSSSAFVRFRTELLQGESGQDYRAKVFTLQGDSRERFLYQEFVRSHHAERIRHWVQGKVADVLGESHGAITAVEDLLNPLPPQFRKDLGLVCESHHLDDLNDLKKYKISQPYGNSDSETANVQYSALLLRTADLLHITSDRTPSIVFKAINPVDPLSQQEWAKQMAVRRVRPQLGRDKEGIPTDTAPQDTIEVHATFTNVDGFFGLTSYLSYVEKQLQKNYDWGVLAARAGSKYKFPWRHVDDSFIETEGFIKDVFEFTVDQARILDLLTGHTLYNDTDVVVRELVQNAIDAVRLQRFESKNSEPEYQGRVSIEWDTRRRTLCVQDNGTGMTQAVIERHLLKVGSSRYQDPDFKKTHEGFSPISRFGIGVLSTFMIADEVDIITAHQEEEQGRYLSLRSLHGKYLIKLLDKASDAAMRQIGRHGTRITLNLRPSSSLANLAMTARKWVVIPPCEVTISEDGAKPIRVGYSSPKEALENICAEAGFGVPRVLQFEKDGLTLAFAVRWSEHFQEQEFIEIRTRDREEKPPMLGTCIEGIRVEMSTPGFRAHPIWAIANVTGPKAPRTNVARTEFENTAEYRELLRGIYSIYADHVEKELKALHSERNFSLTWATQEAKWLYSPLLHRSDSRATDRTLFQEAISLSPVLLVEEDGLRTAIPPSALADKQHFWTIECPFFWSAEQVLREVPGSTSVSALVSAISSDSLKLPQGTLLCESSSVLTQMAFDGREIDKIVALKDQRRLDLRWTKRQASLRWVKPSTYLKSLGIKSERHVFRRPQSVEIADFDIALEGLAEEVAVRAFGKTYFIKATPYTKYLVDTMRGPADKAAVVEMCLALGDRLIGGRRSKEAISGLARNYLREFRAAGHFAKETAELIEAASASTWSVFDPRAWSRKEEEDIPF